MLQDAGYIENTVVLIFWHIQCLHLVYSEIAWVPVSSGNQVQLETKLNPDYLPDYLSVSYDYGKTENLKPKRVGNFYYEKRLTLKLIEVKRKLSSKRVWWLLFTSFRCL